MKLWPWSRGGDTPPEVVTEDRLEALDTARRHLEQRQRSVQDRQPIVEELAGFFRRENTENHLAQRLRRAMEGRMPS